nr:WhiB family transcriptional regulator [Mycolicibacterium fortuitum]
MDPPGDDETPESCRYRTTAAKALCATCPALSACRSWLESLPAQERPTGVVAGLVIKRPGGTPR